MQPDQLHSLLAVVSVLAHRQVLDRLQLLVFAGLSVMLKRQHEFGLWWFAPLAQLHHRS